MKGLMAFVLLGSAGLLTAQPYVEGGKTRHRFAQMYLGADVRVLPSNPEHSQGEFRLLIGGLHFWGHADFFVAARVAGVGEGHLQTRVETGGRAYPWALRNQALRPFVGLAFQTQVYRGEGAAEVERVGFPLTAGVAYLRGRHLLEGFAQYTSQPGWYEPVGSPAATWTNLPAWWFGLAYKYTFETTLSAEKDWQSGRTERVTEILAERHALNGFTVGLGASSAFLIQENRSFEEARPTLARHVFTGVFPEFSVGYYWHNPDIQVNAVYRGNTSTQENEQLKHEIQRRALSLEAYHFVADYHGFAPFVGLTVGMEWLYSRENGLANGQETLVRPGLVCGWDIRPNRLQAWYLRTNIRWAPGLGVGTPDYTFAADQLEINFIQLVVFPGRF